MLLGGTHRAAVLDPHHGVHLLPGRGLPYLRKGTGYDLPDVLVSESSKMCFSLPLPFSSLPEQLSPKVFGGAEHGGQPTTHGMLGPGQGEESISLWTSQILNRVWRVSMHRGPRQREEGEHIRGWPNGTFRASGSEKSIYLQVLPWQGMSETQWKREVLQQGEPGLGSQSPRRGRKSSHGGVPVWGKRESVGGNSPACGAGAPSWGRGQEHKVVCRWGVRM